MKELDLSSNNCSRALVPFYTEESLSQLKRAAFLFDELALAFCTSLPRAKRARFPLTRAFIPDDDTRKRVAAELEWLHDKDVLYAPDEDPFYSGFELEGFEQEKPVWIVRKPNNTYNAIQRIDSSFSVQEALEIPFFSTSGPIFLSNNRAQENISSEPQNRQLVAEVIISQVPEPAVGTPWEAILDWRNDEDAQAKLRRLRHWMNKTSQRSDVNAAHLRDEVLYLMDDYRQAMEVHSFQKRTGTLRTLVTTTAAVLENIAKLKLEKLADLPFQLLGHKIKRDEADLEAPGRELAYIVEVQDSFGQFKY